MSELVVAMGWFIAFSVVTAAVLGIIWQVEPRSVDKSGGGAPPAAHH